MIIKKYPNNDSSINHAGISKCCDAPIKVAIGYDDEIGNNEEGQTGYMECQKCFKPCEIKPK